MDEEVFERALLRVLWFELRPDSGAPNTGRAWPLAEFKVACPVWWKMRLLFHPLVDCTTTNGSSV